MANYLIPSINGGIEILDPIITEVDVFYTAAMTETLTMNLIARIESPVKFAVELGVVTVLTMDQSKDDLILLAQTHLDLQYKVQ